MILLNYKKYRPKFEIKNRLIHCYIKADYTQLDLLKLNSNLQSCVLVRDKMNIDNFEKKIHNLR